MSKHDKIMRPVARTTDPAPEPDDSDLTRLTATIGFPKEPEIDFVKDEALRVCTLNGKQYLVPDRKMSGNELRRRLVFLAGSDALKGTLLVLVRTEEGGRTMREVTPSSIVGSTFAEPNALQIVPPLALYTLLGDA